MDVLPDVEVGQIGEGKNSKAFTFVLARIINIPELWTLILWVPTMIGGTKRKDALLGAGLLFIAASAAECNIEAVFRQRLLQPCGLPKVGMQRAVIEWVDSPRGGLGIPVHDKLHAAALGHLVAHLVHRTKLPASIDMQQREGWVTRKERLAGQMQHDGAILACRIQHHGSFTLRNDFTHDVNAFGFEPLQMRQGDGVILRRLLVHSISPRETLAFRRARDSETRSLACPPRLAFLDVCQGVMGSFFGTLYGCPVLGRPLFESCACG